MAVSIHAPARGATPDIAVFFKHAMFQSTPPRGGRRGFPPAFFLQHGFQSTPPRGGRLCGDTHGLGRDIVSIHAPARGATGKHYVDETNIDVSIHAPARGATQEFAGVDEQELFQSTPPRGGRPS